MFWTRLLSGVVLVILALLLIIPGGIVLLISTCIISLIGLFEYYRALDLHKKPAAWAGYLFTAVYYLNLYFSRNALFSMPKKAVSLYIWKGVPFEMLIVIMLIALLFFYVLSYPKYDIKQITELFFGPVYVSVMLSYIYQARMYTHGKYLVWLIFLTAWGCDTCAYCAGRLFGKHKMSPVLSPKKTVEGAIGGVAGAFLLNLIYMMIFRGRLTSMGMTEIVILSLLSMIGALISMVGDLAASAIKRNVGIKDYGKLIPGHGGILDRFDSILITAPVIYYLVTFIV
ncbi:MAG TPA: phosphatidate cytidylyltransferase [Lachnospiraceae bacterium]|nr:phosphatidate cytidylyltransferase [Lachnospiraceae bacterium]MDD7664782.1 CDP-archaeol synthase [Lachnospiraceae bacterium]MDY4164960.1 CDP-archaeol synthase [Lachnospiraceae bacterium]HAP03980.1 phosphatidate cytidylyltransferase [Lachnospiraceae bacterium]